eukprot:10130340-Karenia_brevis.AAC.1
MSKGRAGDRKGVVIEMILYGGTVLLQCIADLFTSILQMRMPAPEYWSESFVTVLFKNGDSQLPGNYRPITLLPILYKLFSRVLRERLRPILEAAQCVDQAGFRSGFNCDDHLLTIVLLLERFAEFRLPIWGCAIDFQKAFDT